MQSHYATIYASKFNRVNYKHIIENFTLLLIILKQSATRIKRNKWTNKYTTRAILNFKYEVKLTSLLNNLYTILLLLVEIFVGVLHFLLVYSFSLKESKLSDSSDTEESIFVCLTAVLTIQSMLPIFTIT